MTNIRQAILPDTDFWLSMDRHIAKEILIQNIHLKWCFVIEEQKVPLGILRYNLFWDNTPFLTMIYLMASYRRQGIGKRAVLFWEEKMCSLGYHIVMTSTQSDEDAQHFYRSLGYKDAGCLILDTQPSEIFLLKHI